MKSVQKQANGITVLIGVSLSEPHTSVTSLHPCVCTFAWMSPGPTTCCKSLLVLILCIILCIMREFKTTQEWKP